MNVILYGNSMFLAGIKAELESRGQLDVSTIAADCADAGAQIRTGGAAVVIFDLAAAQPDDAMTLLRGSPDLLLIGVDPSSDHLLVLSGQHERAVTTTDLVRVIESWRNSTSPLPLWQAHLDRLRQFFSRGLAGLRARPRRQISVFAFAAIAVCAVLALLLQPTGLQSNASLTGTAVGRLAPELALAFAAGVLLGGLFLALYVQYARHKSGASKKIEKEE